MSILDLTNTDRRFDLSQIQEQNEPSNGVSSSDLTFAEKATQGGEGDISDANLADATRFKISFEVGGQEKTFYFSLLPAVDDGNETTSIPEIKPGVLKKTNMEIKRFQIPGASSAFQMLGVRETILQCVGLFIGNESFESRIFPQDAYDPFAILDAYQAAYEFDQEVVQTGTVCQFELVSKVRNDNVISIKHRCFIQNFRYFTNRDDRVWWAMDVVVLDYNPGGGDKVDNPPQQRYIKPIEESNSPFLEGA